MPTITLPNGNTITYTGRLKEKKEAMERAGIPFTPTNEEIQDDDNYKIFVSEIEATLQNLEQIENASALNNTQIISAIKLFAKAIRIIIRILLE